MSQVMRFRDLLHVCSHSFNIHAQLHSGPDICPEPLSTVLTRTYLMYASCEGSEKIVQLHRLI